MKRKPKPFLVPIILVLVSIIYVLISRFIPDFNFSKKGTSERLGEGVRTDKTIAQIVLMNNWRTYLGAVVSFFLVLFTGFSVLQAFLKRKW